MSTRQIGGLTALRFFAAFAILIHHAKGNFFPPEFLAGLPLDAGVTFFFVLSGFILSHVIRKKEFAEDCRGFMLLGLHGFGQHMHFAH
jgi:peptidoglycan/LPS O-acetylase OafA/YrhL